MAAGHMAEGVDHSHQGRGDGQGTEGGIAGEHVAAHGKDQDVGTDLTQYIKI